MRWSSSLVSVPVCGLGAGVGGHHGGVTATILPNVCLDSRLDYLGIPFRNGGQCGLALMKGTRGFMCPNLPGGKMFLYLEICQEMEPKEGKKL